jgi:hypothetical protein
MKFNIILFYLTEAQVEIFLARVLTLDPTTVC